MGRAVILAGGKTSMDRWRIELAKGLGPGLCESIKEGSSRGNSEQEEWQR